MVKMSKRRSKRDVVEELVDAGFCPPDSWTIDGLARAETTRYRRIAFMGAVASSTPRRVGHDVESLDLAADKYLSRGIANTYWTLWRRMVSAKHAPLPPEVFGENDQHLYPPPTWGYLIRQATIDEEARRLGKTVIWADWWDDLRPRVTARQRAIATFASSIENYDWGYRMVDSIHNELDWVELKFSTCQDRYYGEAA